MFKPLKSLEDLKSKAEHIKKGSILPRRIGKCSKRRLQHLFVAGCNQYALPTPSGYLLFSENNDGEFECALRILEQRAGSHVNLNFKGSPYSDGGCTNWIGNNQMSDEDALHALNEKLSLMWGVK